MTFDKSKYDQEYHKANYVTKRVPFNRQIPEDINLLEYAERQPGSFSAYIKSLIRQDMTRSHGALDCKTNAPESLDY